MESSFSLRCRTPPRSGGSRGRPREIAMKRRDNQKPRARSRSALATCRERQARTCRERRTRTACRERQRDRGGGVPRSGAKSKSRWPPRACRVRRRWPPTQRRVSWWQGPLTMRPAKPASCAFASTSQRSTCCWSSSSKHYARSGTRMRALLLAPKICVAKWRLSRH